MTRRSKKLPNLHQLVNLFEKNGRGIPDSGLFHLDKFQPWAILLHYRNFSKRGEEHIGSILLEQSRKFLSHTREVVLKPRAEPLSVYEVCAIIRNFPNSDEVWDHKNKWFMPVRIDPTGPTHKARHTIASVVVRELNPSFNARLAQLDGSKIGGDYVYDEKRHIGQLRETFLTTPTLHSSPVRPDPVKHLSGPRRQRGRHPGET